MRLPNVALAFAAALTGAGAFPAFAIAQTAPPAPVAFTDGAVGTANASCGAGDECATLKLESGDRVVLYNAGAPHCKPYELRIVRFHGDQVLFSSQQQTEKNADTQGPFGTTCGTFRTTVLTLANGHRLTIDQRSDGTLFARWEAGRTGAVGGTAYEHPATCRFNLRIVVTPKPWDDPVCVDARNLVRSRLGLAAENEPVPMTDGHPLRCATESGATVLVSVWAARECAAARERWNAEHAVPASPAPQPSPSSAPASSVRPRS